MKPDTELHEAMKGLKEVLWRETRYEGVQWYYAEERLYVLRVRTGQPNEHYLLMKAHNPEEAIRRAIYNMKTTEEYGVEKGDDEILPGKDCAGSLRPTRTDPGDYCKCEVEK